MSETPQTTPGSTGERHDPPGHDASAPNAAVSSARRDPGARSRLAANVFIAAFIAFQLAMPLRYYLGDRGYDERFSWRMFSTLRLQQCQMSVEEAAPNGVYRSVVVGRDVQVAWVSLLERARTAVVEKYLARRCERGQIVSARYRRHCVETDGNQLPPETLTLDCARRVLSEALP